MLQLAPVLLDPAPCEIDARTFVWPGMDILLRYRMHEVRLNQAVHDQEVTMEQDGLDLRGRAAVMAVSFHQEGSRRAEGKRDDPDAFGGPRKHVLIIRVPGH